MVGSNASAGALQDAVRAFLRHKGKAAAVFVAVVTGVGLFTFLAPREYKSEGTLFVRLGRENATLDPTATLGQSPIVAVPQSRENEINSMVEILRSRMLLEKVVDSLGPTAITGQDDRERALQQMAKRLTVDAAKKSSVIEIAYQGASPRLCQTVVAALVDGFLDEHVRLNRPNGSLDFFTQQTARLREQLAHKETELRKLKDATGLASPSAQREQIVGRIGRLEDELLHVEAASAESNAKVRELRRQADSLPDTQVASETSGLGNDGTDRMREQFYVLQLREKEAEARYADEHPKMQQIRQQIAAAGAVLQLEEKNRKQVIKEPGRLHQQAQTALLVEEPLLASLEARAGQLKTQLAAVRGELARLNGDEMRLAAVQRDVDLVESDYRKYATNLEQARIDQQLETQRMSNISVVQPASYEPRPVYPRRMLCLLLGICAGAFGALALPLALEQLGPSPQSSGDRARDLDLPEPARVPRRKLRQLVVNGRG
jgi:uncharacterized protein involved in exopolysaccharide biosynthesis